MNPHILPNPTDQTSVVQSIATTKHYHSLVTPPNTPVCHQRPPTARANARIFTRNSPTKHRLRDLSPMAYVALERFERVVSESPPKNPFLIDFCRNSISRLEGPIQRDRRLSLNGNKREPSPRINNYLDRIDQIIEQPLLANDRNAIVPEQTVLQPITLVSNKKGKCPIPRSPHQPSYIPKPTSKKIVKFLDGPDPMEGGHLSSFEPAISQTSDPLINTPIPRGIRKSPRIRQKREDEPPSNFQLSELDSIASQSSPRGLCDAVTH